MALVDLLHWPSPSVLSILSLFSLLFSAFMKHFPLALTLALSVLLCRRFLIALYRNRNTGQVYTITSKYIDIVTDFTFCIRFQWYFTYCFTTHRLLLLVQTSLWVPDPLTELYAWLLNLKAQWDLQLNWTYQSASHSPDHSSSQTSYIREHNYQTSSSLSQKIGHHLVLFVRVAKIKYYILGGLLEDLFSHNSGRHKSKIKVLARVVLSEVSFLDL